MKKILCLLLSISLVAVMFVGCSSSSMKDGTYKAEYSAADSHGWTDYVKVTVLAGKITAVEYDSLDKDGNKKKDNKEYNEAMKNADQKTWPSDFFPKLEAQLVEKQDVEKIDGVAGATDSSNSLKTLVKALSKNMSKGDMATVKVSR